VPALRQILRAYQKFDPTEIDTATILLDLHDALGFNPTMAPAITARQREVIQRHLIEDRPAIEAAKLMGISRWTMWTIERDALTAVLAFLQGTTPPQRMREWQPWQIALLFNGKLTISEVATKVGKSELAVKLMMSRLRKKNEAVPYRRRFSKRSTSEARTE
jgi:hypothetical protein